MSQALQGAKEQCQLLGCCLYPTLQRTEAKGRRYGDKRTEGGEEKDQQEG